jgi:rod shape-determining protein MreD
VKASHIWIAVVVALLAQTTIVSALAGDGAPVDLVLVVVVFAALSRGPVIGLWTGTFAGLIQDALSGGIIGVSGLTKTVVGVLVGIAGAQFIVGTIWHRLVILLAASVVHAFCCIGIFALISPGKPVATLGMVGVQALVNALVGILAEAGVRAPGSLERIRQGRRSPTRRPWTMS